MCMHCLLILARYAKTKCQALEFGLVNYDIIFVQDVRIAHIDNVLVLTLLVITAHMCT